MQPKAHMSRHIHFFYFSSGTPKLALTICGPCQIYFSSFHKAAESQLDIQTGALAKLNSINSYDLKNQC